MNPSKFLLPQVRTKLALSGAIAGEKLVKVKVIGPTIQCPRRHRSFMKKTADGFECSCGKSIPSSAVLAV